jgi:hypothetical protein
MLVAKNEEMVPVAKTRALYALDTRFRRVTCDADINTNTSTSTPAAPSPAQAPPLPPGPVTRARARELNYIMLLKNEGPEE